MYTENFFFIEVVYVIVWIYEWRIRVWFVFENCNNAAVQFT